jgi:DNA-binding MarR family transcriptional regulator
MTDEAMARGSDPISSHIAADAMEDSGKRANHEGLILAGLMSMPIPPKIKSLARVIDLTQIQISRRIAGMREQELIHTTTGEGRNKEMRLHLGPDLHQAPKWVAPRTTEEEMEKILSTVSNYMKPMLDTICNHSEKMGRLDMGKRTKRAGWHYEVSLLVVSMLKTALELGKYLPDDVHVDKEWI